jgi:DNA-binding PadR family transcriptional regulator
MREPTFLILTALAASPLHGYGLIQAVDELSDGQIQLRAGTLYPALDRLTDDALGGARPRGDRGRPAARYYRLTDEGARRLTDEVERLRAHAEAAAARPGGAAGRPARRFGARARTGPPARVAPA